MSFLIFVAVKIITKILQEKKYQEKRNIRKKENQTNIFPIMSRACTGKGILFVFSYDLETLTRRISSILNFTDTSGPSTPNSTEVFWKNTILSPFHSKFLQLSLNAKYEQDPSINTIFDQDKEKIFKIQSLLCTL